MFDVVLNYPKMNAHPKYQVTQVHVFSFKFYLCLARYISLDNLISFKSETEVVEISDTHPLV